MQNNYDLQKYFTCNYEVLKHTGQTTDKILHMKSCTLYNWHHKIEDNLFIKNNFPVMFIDIYHK